MTTTLIQRIRNDDGKTVGVLAAEKNKDNIVNIGWSLCNKNDDFNFAKGKLIAFGRVKNGTSKEIPQSMKKHSDKFFERCQRYFKDCVRIELT